jgi:hypothetical protein
MKLPAVNEFFKDSIRLLDELENDNNQIPDHLWKERNRILNNAKAISAIPEMIDALMGVIHSMEDSRANSGAVYLGDELEKKIKQALTKAGVEL